jgi:hypothetical protein
MSSSVPLNVAGTGQQQRRRRRRRVRRQRRVGLVEPAEQHFCVMCHRQMWKRTAFLDSGSETIVCIVCTSASLVNGTAGAYSTSSGDGGVDGYTPTNSPIDNDAKTSLSAALLLTNVKQTCRYRDFDTTEEDDSYDADIATTPEDEMTPRSLSIESALSSQSEAAQKLVAKTGSTENEPTLILK